MPLITDGGLLVPPPKKPDRSYGILSSIDVIYLEDPHWQGGIEFESDCSVEASSTVLSCTDPVDPLSTDGGLTYCTADPFTVYGSYKCSTGGRLISESMAIATNRLERNKERAVEQIFWTGVTPIGDINPSLQGGNPSCGIAPIDLTPVAGPLNPVAAIAAIESNIAEGIPGGVGVIHVNPGLLPYLFSEHLAIERSGKLYTPSGQLIVAGAGYQTSGPGNVVAIQGETWLFATGPMAVYAGEVFYNPLNINEGVDKSVNSVAFWAEQVFAVYFECWLLAVRVLIC